MTKPLGPCASDEAPVAILQAPPPLAEQEAPIRENYDVDSLLTEHHKEQLELSGKRLEILKEVVPNLTRVAVLANPTHVMTAPTVSELRSAARALGLRIQMHEVAEPGKIEAAFAAMTKQRAGALMMLQDPMFFAHSNRSCPWWRRAGYLPSTWRVGGGGIAARSWVDC
jgi:hypothetical protein